MTSPLVVLDTRVKVIYRVPCGTKFLRVFSVLRSAKQKILAKIFSAKIYSSGKIIHSNVTSRILFDTSLSFRNKTVKCENKTFRNKKKGLEERIVRTYFTEKNILQFHTKVQCNRDRVTLITGSTGFFLSFLRVISPGNCMQSN